MLLFVDTMEISFAKNSWINSENGYKVIWKYVNFRRRIDVLWATFLSLCCDNLFLKTAFLRALDVVNDEKVA